MDKAAVVDLTKQMSWTKMHRVTTPAPRGDSGSNGMGGNFILFFYPFKSKVTWKKTTSSNGIWCIANVELVVLLLFAEKSESTPFTKAAEGSSQSSQWGCTCMCWCRHTTPNATRPDKCKHHSSPWCGPEDVFPKHRHKGGFWHQAGQPTSLRCYSRSQQSPLTAVFQVWAERLLHLFPGSPCATLRACHTLAFTVILHHRLFDQRG